MIPRVLVLTMLSQAVAVAQDGWFFSDPIEAAKASLEKQELVLRLPLSPSRTPPLLGILLSDWEAADRLIEKDGGFVLERAASGGKAPCALLLLLQEPLAGVGAPRLVLDGHVYWEVSAVDSDAPYRGRCLAVPIAAAPEALSVLRAAGRLFGVPESRLYDLRLSAARRAQSAQVEGDLKPEDIDEIRRTITLMARRQVLSELLEGDPARWPDVLGKWPGRHPLQITAEGTTAAVYYAPQAGFQFEKRSGQWAIVGG